MNNWKNCSFIEALKKSINGIKTVFANERNFKIQLVFAIIAIIAGFALKITMQEFAIIVMLIFIVFISEFFNTAIENVVDMVTLEYNEKAKVAKDIAAGAVTLSAILSIITGLLIFLPRILVIINIIKPGV